MATRKLNSTGKLNLLRGQTATSNCIYLDEVCCSLSGPRPGFYRGGNFKRKNIGNSLINKNQKQYEKEVLGDRDGSGNI